VAPADGACEGPERHGAREAGLCRWAVVRPLHLRVEVPGHDYKVRARKGYRTPVR